MKRLSRRNARKWTHEVAAWLEYARVAWGIGNKRAWHVGKNLAGGCWIASFILLMKLRAEGIKAGIAYQEFPPHAFVVTECGWTLDPTYAQQSQWLPFVRRQPLVTREHTYFDYGVPWQSLFWEGRRKMSPSPLNHMHIINRIFRRMGLVEVPQ